MSEYVVSARKYRPMSFDSVVGQQALATTLKSAIQSHRLAHAFLFCGPRGVGKTTCARIFAKSINCFQLDANGNPCNECESCRAFNEQRSFNIVELDAASNNSANDIRDLVEQVHIPPQIGKYKVYIVDEVHMLSTAAFNAFLKTLEEPPAYAIFILATTEKHKILPTILSRCQTYDFTRITVPDIVEQLKYICSKEDIKAEETALTLIAQKADGAMRDALSIFDQVAASSNNNITYKSAARNLNVLDYETYFRLTDICLKGDVTEALLLFQDVRSRGFDAQFFINGFAQHLRDLLVASNPKTQSLLEITGEIVGQYITQAAKCNLPFLYRALELCSQCDLNYRTASNKQLFVELTLIKICQLLTAPTPPSGGSAPNGGGGARTATPQPTQRPLSTPTGSAQPHSVTPSAPQAPRQSATAMHPTPAPVHTATAQRPQCRPQPTYTPPQPTSDRPNFLAMKPTALAHQPATGTAQGNASASQQPISLSERTPYTLEQLQHAWETFAQQNVQRRSFVAHIREHYPKSVAEDDAIVLDVDSEGQKSLFLEDIHVLAQYLRQTLRNANIHIEPNVCEQHNVERYATQSEILRDLMRENPAVAKFCSDFKLTLN